jgi:UDP-N-acetylglucosamine 2-epimerase (non-hydrolysing)
MSKQSFEALPRNAVLCVVGARPNFMKIAPIMHAFGSSAGGRAAALVHTGQHYDKEMKDAFFTQLGIPEPDVDLGVGSGSHAVQTAEVMKRFEPVVDACQPAAVLVVGDVNSTIACALVAAKKGVPVIHVEAGLRSFDRTMPEEINRVLTDQISDLLFTTENSARENLHREGIADERIHFVGNVMIDTLHMQRPKAVAPRETVVSHISASAWEACSDGYAVLTLHRPANVDDARVLRRLLETISQTSNQLPVVFAIHPRTRKAIDGAGLGPLLDGSKSVFTVPPLGYHEMLGLMAEAKLVLTDSGGMQEETTALGVPCVTLRENTERPITIDQGTNTIVGSDPKKILAVVEDTLRTGGKAGRVPELWDGQAAQRIRRITEAWLAEREPARAAV